MLNQTVEQNNLKMIQTEIIDPIHINQQSATFVFRNVGRLSRHTRITLKAVANTANAYYPMNTGLASLVKSAKLLCNGRQLMVNEAVAETVAMNSQFKPPQFRKLVQKARLGLNNTWIPSRKGTYGDDGSRNGKIVPDCDYKDGVDYAEAVNHYNEIPYRLTDDANTTMEGYLSLEDLFPKSLTASNADVLQLPLMFINDEVSLVLTFNQGGSLVKPKNQHRCLNAQADLGNDLSCVIQTDSVKMLVDYLHYQNNSDVGKAIMGEGLALTFGDYNINNFNLQGLTTTPDTRNTAKHNLLLGMTDKTIRQLYCIFKPAPSAEENAGDAWKRQNRFNGRFCSICPSRLPNGVSVNLKINGQNLYVNPVSSYGEQVQRLSSAYGNRWSCPFSTYCNWDVVGDELDKETVAEGGGAVDEGAFFAKKGLISNVARIAGHALLDANGIALNGCNYYLGIDLQKSIMDVNSGNVSKIDFSGSGTTVGNVPIQLTLTRDIPEGLDGDNKELLVLSVVEKTIVIKDGTIEVV